MGDAVCYPIEPHDFHFLSKQLRRWSHGFVQNVSLHWREVLQDRMLGTLVAVALFDALMAPITYLMAVPLLAVFASPWFLVAYLFDLPVIAIPVLVEGGARGQFRKALLSLPAFLVLRQVNSLFMLNACWTEFVLGQSFKTYEKGH